MDRRTVLAFILIAAIILLTPYYMKLITGDRLPSRQERPDRSVQPDEGVSPPASPPPSLAAPPSPDSLRTVPQEPVPSPPPQSGSQVFSAREVVVETDRYLATFSTRGGRVVSVKLKDHRDLYGNWLELIRPGSAGLGLSLDGTSLDDYEFVPDRDGLSLYGDEQGEIAFQARIDNAWIEKRVRFQGNRYRIDMQLSVSGVPRGAKLGVGWSGSLADTEGNQQEDAVYAMVVTRVGGEVDKWDVADLDPDTPRPSGRVSWVGVRNKYFLAALIPPEIYNAEGKLVGRYDLNLEGRIDASSTVEHYHAEVVAAADLAPFEFGVYIGPVSYDLLRSQNTDLRGAYRELDLDEFMDYGFAFIRPILKPITLLILKAFLTLHEIIPNYGLVIVVFSILIKVALFPFTHKSLEASARMQQLQPKIAELREKYGDDQQKVGQETMKLYKSEGVNPLGGCLPMIPQMPILFSLFNVFRGAIELRQSEFILWIDDLSQPDRLFIGGFEIHILPLLMAVSTFYQSKMTMKDPKQAAMVYIMPVFMTWIFWSFSSGLVLYWTMYNILTVLQQQAMERTKKALPKP